MYKSGNEKKGGLFLFFSLLHFCISGCGLKSAALISSYDPNRLTAGGVRMTLARHMSSAESSEKFAALKRRRSYQSTKCFSLGVNHQSCA